MSLIEEFFPIGAEALDQIGSLRRCEICFSRQSPGQELDFSEITRRQAAFAGLHRLKNNFVNAAHLLIDFGHLDGFHVRRFHDLVDQIAYCCRVVGRNFRQVLRHPLRKKSSPRLLIWRQA
ncbi:hypothetical protein [Mesorhizobium sp. WSM3224]|uniref:hypothetical protein n=1 Tax=Mesorhizobium sp. WSM3224 TaxID=1040986 RepID=UPI0004884FE4|nr:hypothetical protein [Mesorhizobium sp. WSM3224]